MGVANRRTDTLLRSVELLRNMEGDKSAEDLVAAWLDELNAMKVAMDMDNEGMERSELLQCKTYRSVCHLIDVLSTGGSDDGCNDADNDSSVIEDMYALGRQELAAASVIIGNR